MIIAVLAVLLCAVVFSFSGCNQGETTAAGEPMVTTIHNTEHMRLTSATTASDNSVTITATVYPEYATNKDVSWSLAWADASSSWATGKTVSDYVSMTSDASSATLTCVQAFGEQIVLTATLIANEQHTANATIDYNQRVIDMQLSLYHGEDLLSTELLSDVISGESSSEYFSYINGASNIIRMDIDLLEEGEEYRLQCDPVLSAYTIDKGLGTQKTYVYDDYIETPQTTGSYTEKYVSMLDNTTKLFYMDSGVSLLFLGYYLSVKNSQFDQLKTFYDKINTKSGEILAEKGLTSETASLEDTDLALVEALAILKPEWDSFLQTQPGFKHNGIILAQYPSWIIENLKDVCLCDPAYGLTENSINFEVNGVNYILQTYFTEDSISNWSYLKAENVGLSQSEIVF